MKTKTLTALVVLIGLGLSVCAMNSSAEIKTAIKIKVANKTVYVLTDTMDNPSSYTISPNKSRIFKFTGKDNIAMGKCMSYACDSRLFIYLRNNKILINGKSYEYSDKLITISEDNLGKTQVKITNVKAMPTKIKILH